MLRIYGGIGSEQLKRNDPTDIADFLASRARRDCQHFDSRSQGFVDGSLRPIFKMAARKDSDVLEPGCPEIASDPLALAATDYSDVRLSFRRSEQQLACSLIHWKQAVSTEDDLVAPLYGLGRLRPQQFPKVAKLVAEGCVIEKLFLAARQDQAFLSTAACENTALEICVPEVLQISGVDHRSISKGGWRPSTHLERSGSGTAKDRDKPIHAAVELEQESFGRVSSAPSGKP